MMDAKDLRIGNLVNWKDEIEYKNCYVSTIDDSGDICLINDDAVISTELKYCSPIPLTEEWLLKFGFEDNCIKGGSVVYELTSPKTLGAWQTYYVWQFNRFQFIPVKFVHSLQNLYFSLTGEELTIQD